MTLQDLINKTCLIGLTYLTADGDVLKQAQYAGTVIKVDEEEGITIKLMAIDGAQGQAEADKTPNFHIPPSLDAWFVAPEGHFKNAEHNIDIKNPDYFVTWDIVKKKQDTEEGKHEWWEWHPKTTAPSVN
ncbi:MAG: hypothetical protein COA99_03180 [Moraxellaceae bacterium]|nr:MAG: hypothetical protein COA99_03180 [Moraxellaceae bacterium]